MAKCRILINHTVYHNGAVYIHSADSGEKYDNVRINPKVSFLVGQKLDKSKDSPLGEFKTVLIYGEAVEMQPFEPEVREALKALSLHFNLQHKATDRYIDAGADYIVVYRIDAKHTSGKYRRVF